MDKYQIPDRDGFTLNQLSRVAITVALEVCDHPDFVSWANDWCGGKRDLQRTAEVRETLRVLCDNPDLSIPRSERFIKYCCVAAAHNSVSSTMHDPDLYQLRYHSDESVINFALQVKPSLKLEMDSFLRVAKMEDRILKEGRWEEFRVHMAKKEAERAA